ncbi:ENV1 protein, partial [Halcyon senegalensis]|nr:ENV1 protein [Halcyon senegalensis]
EILSGNPLLKLMQASYSVLNKTNSNLTEHCWLCFGMKPPFYEAVGVDKKPKLVNSTNPVQCEWETEKRGITLAQITRKGLCVG